MAKRPRAAPSPSPCRGRKEPKDWLGGRSGSVGARNQRERRAGERSTDIELRLPVFGVIEDPLSPDQYMNWHPPEASASGRFSLRRVYFELVDIFHLQTAAVVPMSIIFFSVLSTKIPCDFPIVASFPISISSCPVWHCWELPFSTLNPETALCSRHVLWACTGILWSLLLQIQICTVNLKSREKSLATHRSRDLPPIRQTERVHK